MGAFKFIRSSAFGLGLFAPAMAFAQVPALPSPEIDAYSGIFFFCKRLPNETWTLRACEDAGNAMVTLAAGARKPIVLLGSGDTSNTYPALAKKQGFDSNSAVWFLLTIEPHVRNKGQWEIVARADGVKSSPATSAQPQTVTYSKRTTVISADAVVEKSSELLSSLMLVLTSRLRPL
jgi:hypothetical protein